MKLSVVIPIHEMKGGAEFLWESINVLTEQTFQDFELIITKAGRMAENTNAGIRRAKGEFIKILYLDDSLTFSTSLASLVSKLDDDTEWLITGCSTNLFPRWTNDIQTGNNKLGSPSCLTFRNRFADNLLFDENMSWLLDCDYYRRMYDRFGEPKIVDGACVTIGEGDHQMTKILTDNEKLAEHKYMEKKYE